MMRSGFRKIFVLATAAGFLIYLVSPKLARKPAGSFDSGFQNSAQTDIRNQTDDGAPFDANFFCDRPNVGKVSFKLITGLIKNCDLHNVEGLVKLLPESFRSHYTLAYKSHSLQNSSFNFPRALIFGEDASTVIAFHADPNDLDSNLLEVQEFIESGRRFEYHEIIFPDSTSPKGVQTSQVNPDKCIRCHQLDPRPNWEEYPLWEGFYGSEHDHPKGAELREYLSYLQDGAKTGPYKFLLRDPGSEYYPYQDEKHDYRYRVNEALGRFFSLQNAKRVARMIESNRDFSKFKYFLLADLLECPSVPSGFRQWKPMILALGQKRPDWSLSFLHPNQNFNNLDGYPFDASFRHLVATVIFDDLSQTPELADIRKFYRPSHLLGNSYSSKDYFVPMAKHMDETLSPLDNNIAKNGCPKIIEAGLANSSKVNSDERYASNLTQVLSQNVKTELSKCASCHTTGVAPMIPFDNYKQLRVLLQSTSTLESISDRVRSTDPQFRMPKGSSLSEGLSVEEFLSGLGALKNSTEDLGL